MRNEASTAPLEPFADANGWREIFIMEGIPDITPFKERLREMDREMAEPDFYSDQERAIRISKEQQKVSRLIAAHARCARALRDLEEHRNLLDDPAADGDLRAIAEEEIDALEEESERLRRRVLGLMIPPDEADERNIVVEIRGGAGGDEANIFAGDLFRMYSRYAEKHGWQVEVMTTNGSEAGGFREVIFLIKGEDAYKTLKYESGVHRVQRVPVTESQGRIHTSTSTVAVLPEAREVDIRIDPADLEISVSRASGPGGQGVNTTDSAVQIIHQPTGITVNCADERSQLKNKNKAMAVLRARLLKMKQDEERQKYDQDRKSQVGTGDRSERIRTYNFPQSRITDHRIGYTAHNLDEVMDGDLDDLIRTLEAEDTRAKIENLLREQQTEAAPGTE